jgi:hypothetical protein
MDYVAPTLLMEGVSGVRHVSVPVTDTTLTHVITFFQIFTGVNVHVQCRVLCQCIIANEW